MSFVIGVAGIMRWANFLHIYQPPTQKEVWIRRITNESYRKIVAGLLETPRARVSLNINGVLLELLDRFEGKDVLEGIKKLLLRGQIELTGSAKYHAFLPFLPDEEIERQIRLNEESLDRYFGDAWRTSDHGRRGFFSPEMAYSKRVAGVAEKLGYRWIIIDELACPLQKYAKDTLYTIEGLNSFQVFFRERNASFAILSSRGAGAAPTILRYLGDRIPRHEYLVTAMDGETFGHHRPGLETLLFDLLREPSLDPVQISDLPTIFSNRLVIEPKDSTWAATKKDMRDGIPYSRWRHPENPIQQWQWELTDLAIRVTARTSNDGEHRRLLDEALHSDQYWWASARPWWSLEMIERGAFELKEVIAKGKEASEEERARAEELYKNIVFTGFEWQRNGRVDAISRQEDEEVVERLEEKGKFFITKAEYAQMIKVLEEQVALAAKAEEYHRAAMIKDRIRELREEMEKAKQ